MGEKGTRVINELLGIGEKQELLRWVLDENNEGNSQ